MVEGTEEFAAELYGELKLRAQQYLRAERPGHTLQPTALVHEAFLKLAGQQRASWQNRTQFLAVAATVMRRVLVNHARGRSRQKRSSGGERVPLDDACALFEQNDIALLDLDALISSLSEVDPRASQIVEYRVFAGLTQVEIAELIGVSERTVRNDWDFAKAWLGARLREC